MTPVVRDATPDDVPFLVELRAQMFADMGLDVSGEDWREAATAWFERALTVPDLVAVIVSCDAEDRPVASAVAQLRDDCPTPTNPDGGSALIHSVCVLPTHRGQGLGRACFDAVLDWVRESGVTRVELFATPDGEPIYARSGFTRVTWPAMRLDLPTDL